MSRLVAPLFIQRIQEMDAEELINELNLTPDDIRERFADRIQELGEENTWGSWDDDEVDDEDFEDFDDWVADLDEEELDDE